MNERLMNERLPATIRYQFYRDLQSLTHYVDHDLRQRITSVHTNAKHIATQSKDIKLQTHVLSKQTRKYEDLVTNASIALKQAGDIQNWAEILEVELSALEQTLLFTNGPLHDI
ncbi:hypothetical protein V1512DRAFT_230698 [Lipomyces arxii]|uniref:uncharacterized protein n=1 Tax=Lipomyces arxii TaxID=56418 RepID=UPI0034CD8C81